MVVYLVSVRDGTYQASPILPGSRGTWKKDCQMMQLV